MEVHGDEVKETSARPARRLPRPDEDGIGMIEIMVAFVVFMICFVPLLQLLPEGAKVISDSANQRVATSVANSQLQNAQTTLNPPDFATNINVTNVTPTWATSSTRSATTQSGTTFQIYTVGGWCISSASPGNGIIDSTVQPSYHIMVKVGWGRGINPNSTQHVVVDSTELSSVSGAPTVTTPATHVLECPLGLS